MLRLYFTVYPSSHHNTINNDFQYVSVCLMSIPNAFFSRPVIGPAITCCTLYCKLHCSLYYIINLTQPSKWLANMPCFLRNTPHFMLPLSCTYHYTMYCNTPYTVHGTIHYIIHCTVHCTLQYTLYKHQSDWLIQINP